MSKVLKHGDVHGVKFWLVRSTNGVSAVVECPSCGYLGHLQRRGYGFAVVHREFSRECRFGWTHELHGVMQKIHDERNKCLKLIRRVVVY